MFGFVSRIHNRLKGYRTVIWGSIITLPGVYLTIYDSVKQMGLDITPFFSTFGIEKWLPLFTAISGLLVIIIRMDTKGRIGDKSCHEGGN